jgi:hypothetical protein
VRFVDRKAKPLAGIELFAESELPRTRIGVSDVNGIVRTAIAGLEATPITATETLAADFAETGVNDGDFSYGDNETKAVTLAPGIAVHGRLLLGENEPMQGAVLLLNGEIEPNVNRNWFPVKERRLQSAEGGTFTVPGRVRGAPFRLVALLSPTQRAALAPDKSSTQLWPRAILVPETTNHRKDLGDIRLDKSALVDVQVLAADHSPPGSVKVIAVMAGAKSPREPEQMCTDRHGRLRFLGPFKESFGVIAMTEHGAAVGVTTPQRRKLELTIDPRHAVRVRIVDEDGKPLPSAHAIAMAIEPGEGATDSPEAKFVVQVCNALQARAFPWTTGTTDADGCVQFVMPLLRFDMYLMVVTANGAMTGARVPIPLDRGPGPIDVVFTPDKN